MCRCGVQGEFDVEELSKCTCSRRRWCRVKIEDEEEFRSTDSGYVSQNDGRFGVLRIARDIIMQGFVDLAATLGTVDPHASPDFANRVCLYRELCNDSFVSVSASNWSLGNDAAYQTGCHFLSMQPQDPGLWRRRCWQRCHSREQFPNQQCSCLYISIRPLIRDGTTLTSAANPY